VCSVATRHTVRRRLCGSTGLPPQKAIGVGQTWVYSRFEGAQRTEGDLQFVQAMSFKGTGWLKIISRMNNLEFQQNAGTKVLSGVQMDRMVEG
jgi:hypothetical protein